MKKIIAVTIISIILLAAVITNVKAESKNTDEINLPKDHVQDIFITLTPKTETIETRNVGNKISQIKAKGIGENHPKWKGFEIKGKISNVTPTSFNLNGNTIDMDATITGKLQIKGTLTDGSFVKVEGKIIDEKYYAKEIKIENKKGGDKEDEKNENENEEKISPTINPQISVIPSPEISTTPTPSATPTGTVQKTGDQYRISVAGSLQDIIKALEDLLSKLKIQL